MKKWLSVLLAGAMVLGTLSGCSGGGRKAENEVKTLDVVWFSDGKEGESFMKLADKYMEEHPNIKIELIEVPYADLESKIKNMINGKEAPALARLTISGRSRTSWWIWADMCRTRMRSRTALARV